ncbi:MAG: PorT family protein [Tannerellaceae bacterium]|jgi:hypothetical protein|nr:PorT family protein [Tannerellaceae bacterium]
MKKVLPIMALALCSAAGYAMPTDTTIVVNGKRIEVTEADDRMKIKVFDTDADDDEIEDELIFEGHYRDGRSHESRRSFRSVNIPIPSWNKKGYRPHWDGIGVSFTNISDARLTQINDIDGISLRSGNSLEYDVNTLGKAFPLSPESGWALVTGFGMRWSRYRIDSDHYLAEMDGLTSLQPPPPGSTVTASKLNITSIKIPLLLEWQNRRKSGIPFFLSAGVVGIVKTASSSRIHYKDITGHKQKAKMDTGMNLRPVSADILVQAGIDQIGVYARYSPLGLFEKDKGPTIYPVSIGLQFYFD